MTPRNISQFREGSLNLKFGIPTQVSGAGWPVALIYSPIMRNAGFGLDAGFGGVPDGAPSDLGASAIVLMSQSLRLMEMGCCAICASMQAHVRTSVQEKDDCTSYGAILLVGVALNVVSGSAELPIPQINVRLSHDFCEQDSDSASINPTVMVAEASSGYRPLSQVAQLLKESWLNRTYHS